MSMFAFTEPLLGTPESLKAPFSKANVAGWKAGVALVLCVLSVGAICYPPTRTEHITNPTLRLDATDTQNFMSAPTKQTTMPADVAVQTRPEVAEMKAQQKVQAEALSAAPLLEKKPAAKEDSDVKGPSSDGSQGKEEMVEKGLPADSSDDGNKAAMEVLKEAKRDLTQGEGAARCIAAFLFDREASTACETASPALVVAVTVVLSLYVLFFFAPFYLFPEAAVAIGAWKVFPLVEKSIIVSSKDKNISDMMRMGLFITAVVAVVSRLFILWKERNENCAIGRQGSMLSSLVVAVVLYMIFDCLSALN
jgi:hypothetical protein